MLLVTQETYSLEVRVVYGVCLFQIRSRFLYGGFVEIMFQSGLDFEIKG